MNAITIRSSYVGAPGDAGIEATAAARTGPLVMDMMPGLDDARAAVTVVTAAAVRYGPVVAQHLLAAGRTVASAAPSAEAASTGFTALRTFGPYVGGALCAGLLLNWVWNSYAEAHSFANKAELQLASPTARTELQAERPPLHEAYSHVNEVRDRVLEQQDEAELDLFRRIEKDPTHPHRDNPDESPEMEELGKRRDKINDVFEEVEQDPAAKKLNDVIDEEVSVSLPSALEKDKQRGVNPDDETSDSSDLDRFINKKIDELEVIIQKKLNDAGLPYKVR